MRCGSLINQLSGNSTSPVPVVGVGATLLHWSDRTAGTVVEVSPNGKRIVVQEDVATRTDKNGMSESQNYTYAPSPNGRKFVYTLRKNGAWVAEGQPLRNGERVGIGYRSQYYDYSF